MASSEAAPEAPIPFYAHRLPSAHNRLFVYVPVDVSTSLAVTIDPPILGPEFNSIQNSGSRGGGFWGIAYSSGGTGVNHRLAALVQELGFTTTVEGDAMIFVRLQNEGFASRALKKVLAQAHQSGCPWAVSEESWKCMNTRQPWQQGGGY